jgi:hypothetical protein
MTLFYLDYGLPMLPQAQDFVGKLLDDGSSIRGVLSTESLIDDSGPFFFFRR